MPANTVRAVVRDLADDGRVDRAFLDRVAVTVQRGGQRRTLQVTLGRQPRSAP